MRSDTCRLALLAAVLASAPASRAEAPAWAEDLLRRADVGASAPASFRARIRLDVVDGAARPMNVEVWRRGEDRTLVRFLDPKERGKFLLRRGDALFFLAPGTKRPVRLQPAYRLRGSATLDDVLGIRYARDYAMAAVDVEGAGEGLVAFELEARGRASYPRVRYVVRRATARPVRAEYRLPSGKTASVVTFEEWAGGSGHAYPSRVVVRDALRGGKATAINVLELEPRPVPEELFDLEDPTERRRLPDEAP